MALLSEEGEVDGAEGEGVELVDEPGDSEEEDDEVEEDADELDEELLLRLSVL